MKSLVALAAFALINTVGAFAAAVTLNCTLFPVTFTNGIGGPTIVSCGAFSGGLGTLSSVSVTLLADYQFGNGGAQDVAVTFGTTNPAGVTWAANTTTLHVTGGDSSGAQPTANVACTVGCTPANFAAAFNVVVSSAIASGTGVATSSGAVRVVYSYDPVTPTTPEPISMLLFGSGLLGVYILGRKKFAK